MESNGEMLPLRAFMSRRDIKTNVACKYFEAGNCARGSRCRFAHGQIRIKTQRPRQKQVPVPPATRLAQVPYVHTCDEGHTKLLDPCWSSSPTLTSTACQTDLSFVDFEPWLGMSHNGTSGILGNAHAKMHPVLSTMPRDDFGKLHEPPFFDANFLQPTLSSSFHRALPPEPHRDPQRRSEFMTKLKSEDFEFIFM
eukprot:symbB.v1.2.031659.t1/scaffold3699.1/size54244/3